VLFANVNFGINHFVMKINKWINQHKIDIKEIKEHANSPSAFVFIETQHI